MPKRVKNASKDANQAAHALVKRVTGGDGSEPTRDELSRVMAALGRKGGKVGGKRRLETMTPERRSAVALAAARARWAKANYAKAKNVPEKKRGQFGYGDVWTWTALDADSKLIVSWLVAPRDAESAFEFMSDLGSRITSRIQLTTDGYRKYATAVEGVFGIDIDYAMLTRFTRRPGEKRASTARRR